MPENESQFGSPLCLLTKPIEWYHSKKYFTVFVISLRIFTIILDSWNSDKNKSTRAKLTLFLPIFKYGVTYFDDWQK